MGAILAFRDGFENCTGWDGVITVNEKIEEFFQQNVKDRHQFLN